jgi:hypothetical protein
MYYYRYLYDKQRNDFFLDAKFAIAISHEDNTKTPVFY